MYTILRFSKIPLRSLGSYTSKLILQQQRNVAIESLSVASTEQFTKKYEDENSAMPQNFKKHLVKLNNEMNKPLEFILATIQEKIMYYEFVDAEDFKTLLKQLKVSGYVPSSSILFLIHSCGNFMCYVNTNERRKLADELWKILQSSGTKLDVSIYNALLQIYIENDKHLDPMEMLNEMRKNNIKPNRVTFDKIIHFCCLKGDMKKAIEVLNLMNEQKIPINSNIFSSLIMGHAEAGDIESSIKMLDVMKEGGLQHDSETYCALMQVYAKTGNMEKIQEILTECKNKDIHLTDVHFANVIGTLIRNNHPEHVEEIIRYVHATKRFMMEMTVLMFQLIEKKDFKLAFKMLEFIPLQNIKQQSRLQIVSSLINAFIQANSDQVINLCKTLVEQHNFKHIYKMVWRHSVFQRNPKMALKILIAMKDSGQKIHENMFWPILCLQKDNIQGASYTIHKMISEFNIQPDPKTLATYYIPFLNGNLKEVLNQMMKLNVNFNTAVNALILSKLEALKFKTPLYIVKSNPSVPLHPVLIKYMAVGLSIHDDVSTFVDFARYVKENHDDKYTVSNGLDLYEEEPENIELNDFIAISAVNALGRSKTDRASMVFQRMKEEGLGITKETADKIKAFYGNNVTHELAKSLEELSAGNLEMRSVEYPYYKEKNKLMEMFSIQCQNEEEENAIATIKAVQENGDTVTPGMYVKVINLCMKKDKFNLAKELMTEAKKNIPNIKFTGMTFVLQYGLHLLNNGEMEEAIQFIEQNYEPPSNEKLIRNRQLETTICSKIVELNNPDFESKILRIFSGNNEIPKTETLRPLVKHYVDKGEFDKALDKFEYVSLKYHGTPLKFELMKHFIEKEDAANLQRLTNICASVRGEMQALFDLAIAFLESGKINQARKLFLTPGLKLEARFFYSASHYYQQKDDFESVKRLVNVTKDLYTINRQELFEVILEPCMTMNDWENGLSLWMQMQEENLIPSKMFLDNLARLLLKNNQNIPFVTDITKDDVVSASL